MSVEADALYDDYRVLVGKSFARVVCTYAPRTRVVGDFRVEARRANGFGRDALV